MHPQRPDTVYPFSQYIDFYGSIPFFFSRKFLHLQCHFYTGSSCYSKFCISCIDCPIIYPEYNRSPCFYSNCAVIRIVSDPFLLFRIERGNYALDIFFNVNKIRDLRRIQIWKYFLFFYFICIFPYIILLF